MHARSVLSSAWCLNSASDIICRDQNDNHKTRPLCCCSLAESNMFFGIIMLGNACCVSFCLPCVCRGEASKPLMHLVQSPVQACPVLSSSSQPENCTFGIQWREESYSHLLMSQLNKSIISVCAADSLGAVSTLSRLFTASDCLQNVPFYCPFHQNELHVEYLEHNHAFKNSLCHFKH